jgi:hypothetical protein
MKRDSRTGNNPAAQQCPATPCVNRVTQLLRETSYYGPVWDHQRGGEMSWDHIPRERKAMSEADRRAFDRWLKANAIAGVILVAGIIAMAFAGFNSAKPGNPMVTQRTKSPDTATAASGYRAGVGARLHSRQNVSDR